MFGFGRSANEKVVIKLFTSQLEAIGISANEAIPAVTKIVDEVLGDIRARGIQPFKSTQGSEYIAQNAFMEPRIAAGLKNEDVRTHWNRPLLVVLCENKMRELINFIVVDIAHQQGKDVAQASDHYKKFFPRYGDPVIWDPSEKFNAGLRQVDADLYPEFATRVDAWRRRTGEVVVARLIEQHGTLNAAVRAAVLSRAL